MVWATRVLPRNHNVECSAELMRGSCAMQHQSRAVDQRAQLDGAWIIKTVN